MITTFAHAYKSAVLHAVNSIDLTKVAQARQVLAQACSESRQIFVFGNGGSASTASHFATEIVKSASFGRSPRFRIVCLADSISTLTAYSNDISYDCVFAEQLKNFATPGDIVMAISSSGNSTNVLRAVEYANKQGCVTIALTGRDGGALIKLAQINLHVNHWHTGRIEDAHMIILHMIGYSFIEQV